MVNDKLFNPLYDVSMVSTKPSMCACVPVCVCTVTNYAANVTGRNDELLPVVLHIKVATLGL